MRIKMSYIVARVYLHGTPQPVHGIGFSLPLQLYIVKFMLHPTGNLSKWVGVLYKKHTHNQCSMYNRTISFSLKRKSRVKTKL